MPIALVALLACEADLTLGAIAIGLSLRGSRVAIVTGVVSITFTAAVFILWLVWFVAPGCVANSECAVPASSYVDVAAGAAAQWTWLLAVAMSARFAKRRNLAHISG